jgi:two-component system phosphate regulon response regulator PhoB
VARVLLILADVSEAEALEQHLARAGHVITRAASGKEGVRRALEAAPEMIIADMVLGDISGTEMCRNVRVSAEAATVPVMLMSERGDEIDRVVAFEVGADDFISKPYSQRELVLRVRAILRRRRREVPLAGTHPRDGLELDASAHRVTVGGREVALSALEFRLLTTLFQRRSRVQSRGALLDEVWGGVEGVSLRTVDACVKRLRQKLGHAGRQIHTVRGVGYRFSDRSTGAEDGDELPG